MAPLCAGFGKAAATTPAPPSTAIKASGAPSGWVAWTLVCAAGFFGYWPGKPILIVPRLIKQDQPKN